ncbi:GntR family transcriptional regulator [Sabulicella rubraurantiaca]|uniref:GntR family transcriptional regulator n=1 Tax=Sabulicella rubraurantiaca TaxID=2811429 RepID=UPI001A971BC8|nr:GntR family transcriptional regulator [Sabulicella rubraurantiaca]
MSVSVARKPFARPDSLPERLALWLREEILEERIAPGSRLVESELASRCGVSRVPLREAFRILAQEGLIELSLHKGAAVRPLSATELRELFGVRSAIEAFAAGAAARNPASAEPLAALVDQMREAVGNRDVSGYRRLAAAFHEALVAAGGNELLAGMYSQIRTRLRRYQAAMARLPDLPGTSIAEHDAIVAAIAAGDVARASSLATAHLDSLVDQLPLPGEQQVKPLEPTNARKKRTA